MSYGSPPPPPGQPPYGQNPYGQDPYGQNPYGQGGPGAPAAAGDPGTLDLPYYGIGFVPAIKRAFAKYARFDGRASRSEYWWFALGSAVIGFVLYIPLIIGAAADAPALTLVGLLLLGAFFLATIVPSIAVAVRRLHDGNFSGWLYLIALIPCGSIVLLVLMCLPSKPEGARFDRGNPGVGPHAGGYGNPYGH